MGLRARLYDLDLIPGDEFELCRTGARYIYVGLKKHHVKAERASSGDPTTLHKGSLVELVDVDDRTRRRSLSEESLEFLEDKVALLEEARARYNEKIDKQLALLRRCIRDRRPFIRTYPNLEGYLILRLCQCHPMVIPW